MSFTQRATGPMRPASLPEGQVPRTMQRAVLQLCVCMVPGQSPAAIMAESGASTTLHGPQHQMTSVSLATWRAVIEPELGQRRAPDIVGKMSDPLSRRTQGPESWTPGTDLVP